MSYISQILLFFLIPFSFAQDKELESGNDVTIKFNEFNLQIENIEIWDENHELKEVQNDTALVSLDIGEILTGNKIKITDNQHSEIKIFERIENSVTITNEGPHCDLTNWKHFTSQWTELKQLQNGVFKSILIDPNLSEKFIDVDIDDFKKHVKEFCGDDWAELIKDIKNIKDYPCEIGTSKIELKVVIIDNLTKKTIERYLLFDVPMGC